MAETIYLKCSCKECGNHIEFPDSAAGTTVACPHCGQWTELLRPEEPPARKSLNLGLVAIICCVLALISLAAWFYHSKAKSRTEITAVPTDNPAVKVVAAPTNLPPEVVTQAVVEVVAAPKPKSHTDLKPGKIELEKTAGSSLVYAVGTLTNDSTFQRFGVKVELDLFNKEGDKIGTTQDYKDIIEPRKNWRFHALIPDKKTASAKITAVTEEE